MLPAPAKQGTSLQRHLTYFRFSKNKQCGLFWSVCDNQLDQYRTFTLSRTCYWKKLLVNHLSILHTKRQSKLAEHSKFELMHDTVHDNSLKCWFVYLKSVKCRWRLDPYPVTSEHVLCWYQTIKQVMRKTKQHISILH